MSYKHLNFCENTFKSRVIIKFAELTSTFLLLRLNGIKNYQLGTNEQLSGLFMKQIQQIGSLKACCGGVA